MNTSSTSPHSLLLIAYHTSLRNALVLGCSWVFHFTVHRWQAYRPHHTFGLQLLIKRCTRTLIEPILFCSGALSLLPVCVFGCAFACLIFISAYHVGVPTRKQIMRSGFNKPFLSVYYSVAVELNTQSNGTWSACCPAKNSLQAEPPAGRRTKHHVP